jgi:hypothetical protein
MYLSGVAGGADLVRAGGWVKCEAHPQPVSCCCK